MSGVQGMVHLTHPETGGEQLAPADSVPLWTARGWVASESVPERYDHDAPVRGDVPVEPAAEPAASDTAEATAEATDTTEASAAEAKNTKEKNRA